MGKTIMFAQKRVLGLLVAAALCTALDSGAQTKEVEVGLIAPMSGPYARQG
jgi:hypothetical protein